jgi:hypothetical protein
MDRAFYYYNNHGHLELWDVTDNTEIENREADLYVQEDVKEFLESFGINEKIEIGDTGYIEDYQ